MSRVRLAAAGLLAVVVLLALGAAGVRWDPFRLEQRRLEAAQAAAVRADAHAHARSLEAQGEREQAVAAARRADRVTAAETATDLAIQQTKESPDAHDLLAPGRRDRLRAHDLRLCALAGHDANCAAAPGHPADR